MQSSEVTYIRFYFDLIKKMKHPIFNFDESMWRISDSHNKTPFWIYLPLTQTFWSLKKGDPTPKLISNIRLSQIYIIRNYSWYRWMIFACDWWVIGLLDFVTWLRGPRQVTVNDSLFDHFAFNRTVLEALKWVPHDKIKVFDNVCFKFLPAGGCLSLRSHGWPGLGGVTQFEGVMGCPARGGMTQLEGVTECTIETYRSLMIAHVTDRRFALFNVKANIQWNVADNARETSLYDLQILLKTHLHPNSFVVFSVYSRFLKNILLRHIMDFGMFFLNRFPPHISLIW